MTAAVASQPHPWHHLRMPPYAPPADPSILRPELIGPFDIIGDVHGCGDELEELLARLGYTVKWDNGTNGRHVQVTPPPGRTAVYVGDLVDRGPRTPDVLRLVMAMVKAGAALCVMGNHDLKFKRWLAGRSVEMGHGLAESVQQMQAEPAALRAEVYAFLGTLPDYLCLDGGRLTIAHAGIEAWMIGKISDRIRSFCLYGDRTNGERDASGLTVRYNWAAAYAGPSMVAYGHTPVAEATRVNNTICLDTGCCFGGRLTALRWPEQTLVSVPARRNYVTTLRPFGLPPARAATVATKLLSNQV
jgi:protein phosphatase